MAAPAPAPPATVSFNGTHVPLDWLVRKHDPKAYPRGAVVTPKQQRQARRDLTWACSREQLFAAAAAGVHVAIFAYNLAFWGSEGMPPDRYWPDNTRSGQGGGRAARGCVHVGGQHVARCTPVHMHGCTHASTPTHACMHAPLRRLKMGVRPGRFGNLDGARRVWYENLARLENIK